MKARRRCEREENRLREKLKMAFPEVTRAETWQPCQLLSDVPGNTSFLDHNGKTNEERECRRADGVLELESEEEREWTGTGCSCRRGQSQTVLDSPDLIPGIQESRHPGITHRSRRFPFETNVKVICENLYAFHISSMLLPGRHHSHPPLTGSFHTTIQYTIQNTNSIKPDIRNAACASASASATPPASRFNGYRMLLAATEVYDPRAALGHRRRSLDVYEAEFELELELETLIH